MKIDALKLCLVSHINNQPFHIYRSLVLKAIQGGVTSVQLRDKTNSLTEFEQLARQFRRLLRPFSIPLIINDHVEVAKAIDAEGVHIGQSDLAPEKARAILGADKFIGLSVETEEELMIANTKDVDYVAASAIFKSRTKPDCKTLWGLDGLRKCVGLSVHPVVAIGGINKTNVASVMECGASGVAVIGALHTFQPARAAEEMIIEMDNVLNTKRYSP